MRIGIQIFIIVFEMHDDLLTNIYWVKAGLFATLWILINC